MLPTTNLLRLSNQHFVASYKSECYNADYSRTNQPTIVGSRRIIHENPHGVNSGADELSQSQGLSA